MPSFELTPVGATAESDLPNEGWATSDFDVDQSIEVDMQIPQYPWEVTPDFAIEPSAFVSPFANTLLIAGHDRVEEAARDYLNRVQGRLPEDVRESFTSGAGMFHFPAPPDLDDHLL